MIDSSTAEYWVNKKPCNLYSLRLSSALDCHKYAFAMKKDSRQNYNNLWPRLQRAIHDLKRNGELERLKTKWWPPPRECSAAAAAFIIIELNVLLVIITKIHYHCPSSHLAYGSCCSCLGASLLSKYSILAVVRLLLCIYISLCTLILYRTMHIVDIRDSFECIDYTAQCSHRNEIKCCADGFVNIVMHML